jgi:hypothetical protein
MILKKARWYSGYGQACGSAVRRAGLKPTLLLFSQQSGAIDREHLFEDRNCSLHNESGSDQDWRLEFPAVLTTKAMSFGTDDLKDN